MNSVEFKKIDTPEKILKWSSKVAIENIEQRRNLHTFLFNDKEAKERFLAMCYYDPRLFFNLCLWTFNAQAPYGRRHIPFILWDHQEPAVLRIKKAIETQKDLLFDKSRKQGATYIILGSFLLYWLVSPGSMFLLGSRKEDLVDNGSEIIEGSVVGSEEALFYKLLYMISALPLYLQPKIYKKHLFLQNLETESAFRGDTTNIGFGKGFRTLANLVDEAAQIDPKMAGWIIENIADTAPCSIFNSTTGPWGQSHPYSKLLKSSPGSVVVLDWSNNPEQNVGLYRSPKEGFIEIKDLDYYKKLYPGRFEGIEPGTLIPIKEVEKTYPFIADGGVSNWGCWRSVWVDADEKRPGRTKRGMAQNLYRIETGATDAFFDYELIMRLRERIKNPDYCSDVSYSRNSKNDLEDIKFDFGGKDSPLYLWESLENGRPNQRHNYTVGCDISRGTGASNSVAAIYDVNTNKVVGLYVNPYIKISDFAEKAVAICHWVGGASPALLNWEINNSPEFLDRVRELGYYNLYVRRDTSLRKTKLDKKYGWHSTGGIDGTKRSVLNELSAALSEGLLPKPRFTPCRIYDGQLIDELENYVNYEGKIDVGPVSLQTETSGAKAAHGDRVIAVSLALLAAKSQTKADKSVIRSIPDGSFAARMIEVERRVAEEKAKGKVWYY